MNRKYRVSYSLEALNDLKSIYAYIAFRLKERNTAKDQTRRIRREVRSLEEMPERYALVDWEPWASMDMRKLPVDNFVVYYLVDQEKQLVNVVRIFYGGRDIENIVQPK